MQNIGGQTFGERRPHGRSALACSAACNWCSNGTIYGNFDLGRRRPIARRGDLHLRATATFVLQTRCRPVEQTPTLPLTSLTRRTTAPAALHRTKPGDAACQEHDAGPTTGPPKRRTAPQGHADQRAARWSTPSRPPWRPARTIGWRRRPSPSLRLRQRRQLRPRRPDDDNDGVLDGVEEPG